MKVFASHDWGCNGANHERVRRVVSFLRDAGVDVWFDETHMKGNVLDAMCKGISDADLVLVFVTSNYVHKVQHGDDTDNVRREFMFAKDYPQKLVSIRFDGTLPAVWPGPVGMILGSHLYTDLTLLGDRTMGSLLSTLQQRAPGPTPRPSKAVRARSDSLMRARVKTAVAAMGGQMTDSEHTGDALERLAISLCGTQVAQQPFVRKLAAVERELGLAAASGA